jgi:uncharacterized membrane protein (Fun14 family)
MLLNIHLSVIILNIKAPLLSELGGLTFGGIAGFASGFALKKMFKMILIIGGVLFIVVQLFSYTDILAINWHKIQFVVDKIKHLDTKHYLPILTAHLPTAGGFLVGFVLGLKKS